MTMFKLACSGVALGALVLTSGPADAQSRHWRHHYGRYHDRGGIDGGDFLLGAVVAGGIIALAAAASKNNRRYAPPRYDGPPRPPSEGYADGYEAAPAGYDDGGYDAQPGGYDDRYGEAAPSSGANAAADACAAAAESEAGRFGAAAHVLDISDVDPANGGGFFVKGSVSVDGGYADSDQRDYGFRCSILPGQGPSVRIDGLT